MKKLIPFAAALAFLVLPVSAFADTFTYTSYPTSITAPNTNGATDNTWESDYAGGTNQFDLDHHNAYVWKLNGLSVPAGHSIVSARIVFRDIANWDTNANILYAHLLNFGNGTTGCGNSVSSSICAKVIDNSGDTLNGDYFASANALGPGPGADNTFLFSNSFNKVGQNGYTATNYTYNFTAAQLAALAAYINANGNIAFGFDPDCHYWNNGIKFEFTTAPQVPEPMSLILLGSGLGGLYLRRRRQQNKV